MLLYKLSRFIQMELIITYETTQLKLTKKIQMFNNYQQKAFLVQ